MAAPVENQTLDAAERLYEESTIHWHCQNVVEQLKSTSMAGALRKYKTLLNGLIQIGGGAHGVNLHEAVLNNEICNNLRDAVIQTIVLEKHIDGLADGSEHQAKLTSIQEDPAVIHKWEAAMEIGLSNGSI
jgi:hypothetical protein